MYRAVILDVDGTLVDSNDAHARAWAQALAEHGRDAPFTRIRPLIGMGADKLMPALAGIDADTPQGRAISTRRREIFQRDYVPRLQPTRGAQQLLEWLRDEGLTLVAATSADAAEVEELLRVAGATKLLDAVVTSDDAAESKPEPDVVRAALRRADCAPGDAIMIGDTPYDVEAAARAGLGAIALRCGGWWSDETLAGAVAIYDDPDDLVRRFALSPFKRPVPVRWR